MNYEYDGKNIPAGYNNGQWMWIQEFGNDINNRSIRGCSNTAYGVANSSYYSFSNTNDYCGWRPVLEPLNE